MYIEPLTSRSWPQNSSDRNHAKKWLVNALYSPHKHCGLYDNHMLSENVDGRCLKETGKSWTWIYATLHSTSFFWWSHKLQLYMVCWSVNSQTCHILSCSTMHAASQDLMTVRKISSLYPNGLAGLGSSQANEPLNITTGPTDEHYSGLKLWSRGCRLID